MCVIVLVSLRVFVCLRMFALVCVCLCKAGQVDGVSFLAAGSVLVCVTYEPSRKQCSLTKLWCVHSRS